jgi:hypothetical protein
VALGGTSYAVTRLPAHSVGTKQLKIGAVGTKQLKNGSVTSPKIADHSVLGRALAHHSVGQPQLGVDAVRCANVAKDSLSLADLVGVDIDGLLHGDAGAVPANSCVTAPLEAGGAQVGQAILITFIGAVPAPQGLVFEPIKVTSPGEAMLRFCNPTNVASPAFSNVGVRIVTFG